MDYESRLPRRMLSAWVPSARPAGAPEMTYGRSLGKALEKFGVDPRRWAELAADRGAWRQMLRVGFPPDAFRPRPPSPLPPPPPPPPAPEPLARTKPKRAAAVATNAKIDACVAALYAPLSPRAPLRPRN